MQIVILAGGMGTRLKAVAGNLPKAMVPVAGKPFIEHQLALIKKSGAERVLLCTGYRGELIENHLGDGRRFGLNISYSRESPDKLLGTGGALVNAYPKLEDMFLVIYGDSYLPTDYGKVFRTFQGASLPALMCVYRNLNQWDRSNVKIAGSKVVFYSKAPGQENPDYIDYGLSGFKKSVIEQYTAARLPLDLAAIQASLVEDRLMAAHVVAERFYEIGKPSGLDELDKHLRSA